jgi:thiol-disulfide isomerase/thioredoxin/YHS domain-containing protein
MRMLGGSLSICLIVGMTTGGAEPKVAAAEKAQAAWFDNFEAAQQAAERIDRPLLIHFHAPWCGPCRQMEQSVLNTDAVLKQLGSRVVGVKINSDTRPDLVSRYQITALPSDVFVTPDGSVLTRGTGGGSADGYKRQMLLVSNRYVASQLRLWFASSGQPVKQAPVDENDSVEPAKVAGAASAVALKGFSPVSIVDRQKWNHGSPEFSASHDGAVYHMASAAELQKFKAKPERYVPGWLGHDPLEVVTSLESVIGDIRFAAFYRKKLYLLSSEKNRRNFLANPSTYEDRGKKL